MCRFCKMFLKTISGHVVAKKWHVKNAVSTPILFQRIFLENSHNNMMSYKYLHFIRTCIFPIIQSCTRVLVSTLTQQFNRIFVPFVFCFSEFCMNIFISIFTQYCPHSILKKLTKNCTWSVFISIQVVSTRYLKSINIWGTSILIKPNPTILFIF